MPPFALYVKMHCADDHTAYSVVFAFVVNESPGLYVALVAVLLVDQPRNVYPVLVGVALLNVSAVPWSFVCSDGAPMPPFALYCIAYDVVSRALEEYTVLFP